MNRFAQYIDAVRRPHRKLCKIEFLQPDGSVAFALGTPETPLYNTKHNTNAFIQDGTLSVNLQNGIRRKATVLLSNLDDAFDFSVNHIWFGQEIRLSMGLVLPDGTDFYLPQGVFLVDAPTTDYKPGNKTATYNLVDKWANLDGEQGGNLDCTHVLYADQNGVKTNVFEAMASVLKWSKYNFEETSKKLEQIDSVAPVFTTYYDGKTYTTDLGEVVNVLDLPYDITISGDDATIEDILFALNAIINGWIGYDRTGALRVDASQDDISDANKPILWEFDESNSTYGGVTETNKTNEVKNDVLIIGAGLDGGEIYGRAYDDNSASSTSIMRIGRKTHVETRAEYWISQQCIDYAKFLLKRKTILQKEISIESSQLYHLDENALVTVRRNDTPGSPIEKHLIQSYSLPFSEQGGMSITAVSVNDLAIFATVISSDNLFPKIETNTYTFSGGGYSCTFDVVDGAYTATGSTTSGLRTSQHISLPFNIAVGGTFICEIQGDPNAFAGPFEFGLVNAISSQYYRFKDTQSIPAGDYYFTAKILGYIPDGVDIGVIQFTPIIRRISQEVL